MQSLIQLLGLPREFGITLLILTLAFALLPYLAGYDFGIFRLPSVDEPKRRLLRKLGPVSFVFALLLHAPMLRPRPPELGSVAVLPFTTAQLSPRQLTYAKVLSSKAMTNLQADDEVQLVSPRSARILGEREHAGKVAEELKVAYLVEGDLSVTDTGTVQLWLSVIDGASGRTVLSKEICVSGSESDTLPELATQISDTVRGFLRMRTGASSITVIRASNSLRCGDDASRSRASILLSFEPETALMTQSAYSAVKVLAEAMKSDKLSQVDFTIYGHVKPSGNADRDLRLSEARAIATKAMLVELGVESFRLATRGKGSAEMMDADNVDAPVNERITVSASAR